MKKLNLEATTIFQKNYDEWKNKLHRFIVNEGGTGSSKTYSIAQLFLIILITEKNANLTICRNNLPQLRGSAMKDFFDIVKNAGIYREDHHNKSDRIYRYGNNEVNFISVEEAHKLRSQKRDYLWINEANEISLESFRQMNMRTKKQVWMDYNPSDEFHWIYDVVLARQKAILIRSTYLDNPYLDKEIINEIEHYKETDKNYWNIYGLGLRGISELKIYNTWSFCDELPEGEIIYGLDFGFNHPTALVQINLKDDDMYWKELLYETHLTDVDIVDRLKTLNISKTFPIYADSEKPDSIEFIRKAGYNIRPAKKDKGSVAAGIKMIKSRKFYLTKDSLNLLKELKSYSWIEKDGKPTDEVVKANDHLLDGGRYAIYTHLTKPKIELI